MTIIYIVLPLALIVVGVALWAFVWSAKSGQFDDLETPAIRMVHDDDFRRQGGEPPVRELTRGGPTPETRPPSRRFGTRT